jgi:hypothetical protein
MNLETSSELSYIEVLSKSIKKYSEIVKDSSGYRMKYQMKVSYRFSPNVSDQTFEMLYKGKKIKLNSDDYHYYCDSLAAIIINPEKKKIYVVKSQMKESSIQNINSFIGILDSIIKYSELINFHYQEKKAHIRLKLNEDMKPPYNDAVITYIINTINYDIENIKVNYNNPKYNLKDLEINFLLYEKVNYDIFFDLPLVENIFESNGKLREEYKDFELITK